MSLYQPRIRPPLVDSMWFMVDPPIESESDIEQMEKEHQAQMNQIQNMYSDLTPIGKTTAENLEEEDEEDEEDDDNDDDTDSPDEDDEDEIDMEISYEHYERNSPVDVSIRMVQGQPPPR